MWRLVNFVDGRFENEAEFQAAVMKVLESRNKTVFHLEEEEVNPGMPDLLVITGAWNAHFVEVKYADKKGYITFQKSQPLFYKKYFFKVSIDVLVYDPVSSSVLLLKADDIVEKGSLRYNISHDRDYNSMVIDYAEKRGVKWL